jgi:siroheme synthase (precorrin-2 oxidase/ferrochelatase)
MTPDHDPAQGQARVVTRERDNAAGDQETPMIVISSGCTNARERQVRIAHRCGAVTVALDSSTDPQASDALVPATIRRGRTLKARR